MNHSFNVEAAAQVGLKEAIILENIRFWCEKNRANNANYHDGNYWTYNSVKAFSALFPYMTEKQIRSALSRLENDGYIIVGNFNKTPYDRTKWYAVTEKGLAVLENSICPNGKMKIAEKENENTENGEPIPDINTDMNTDINTDNRKRSALRSFLPKDRIESYTANQDLRSSLIDFAHMRKQIKKPLTERALVLCLNKLDKLAETDRDKIEIVDNSVMNSWQGFYPLKRKEISERDYSEYL